MPFIHDDFLLRTKTARRLYHEFAEDEPILDYHTHLPPDQNGCQHRGLATWRNVWLGGDHYKWRAMRANGVSERFCTGDAEPYDKFLAWARTVPQTLAESALPLDSSGVETVLRYRRTARRKECSTHLGTSQRTAQYR